jgi:hypothetical protein
MVIWAPGEFLVYGRIQGDNLTCYVGLLNCGYAGAVNLYSHRSVLDARLFREVQEACTHAERAGTRRCSHFSFTSSDWTGCEGKPAGAIRGDQFSAGNDAGGRL